MTYQDKDKKYAANVYNHLKSRIKSKGTEFNWTKEEFILWYGKQDKKCSYCGCEKEIIEKRYEKWAG